MKKRQICGWLERVVLCVALGLSVVGWAGCEKQRPVERHIELHEQVHEQIMAED